MPETKTTRLKKRQQIESAGRTMFIWVAIASVALSFFVVAAQFLYTQWSFNQKVYSSKQQASQTLTTNITSANNLKKTIDDLVGNQDLSSVAKTSDGISNTQVVLDALPGTYDAAALATSLQKAILSRSGVSIESISVPNDGTTGTSSTSATGTGTTGTTGTTGAASTGTDQSAAPVPVPFTVVVTGTYDKISNMLKDLESTIRPMQVTGINAAGNDSSLRVTLNITTYYQPSKTVNIQKQVVKS